jgi:hypothetical protein
MLRIYEFSINKFRGLKPGITNYLGHGEEVVIS